MVPAGERTTGSIWENYCMVDELKLCFLNNFIKEYIFFKINLMVV
jgi:hypothetical protein